MRSELSLPDSIWTTLAGPDAPRPPVEVAGTGSWPGVFPVAELAAASIGVAGAAVAELSATRTDRDPLVRVDRRLAALWFASSLRPQGWTVPPAWDALAGDYPTTDGWIRLHTNAPHHRAAALRVLDVAAEPAAVAAAVATWSATELETAVVEAGGCAAAMRTTAEWDAHPQGRAVATEPLIHVVETTAAPPPKWSIGDARPLAGLRVLDLTRVLAGPIATRFLAGLGADVLRIDPPDWHEPAVVPEMTVGKRCALLDLRDPRQHATLVQLLGEADVLVHGYRPDALAGLGLGAPARQAIRPGLVDVSLNAYGWTGPWCGRRGFDSLVQMSSGIAAAGMHQLRRPRPTPLPVQALDQATGYLLAAAALRGLTHRLQTGHGSEFRTSLARVAALLISQPSSADQTPLAPETTADLAPEIEHTPWGPARRLRPPLLVDGTTLHWTRPASELGTAEPRWTDPP